MDSAAPLRPQDPDCRFSHLFDVFLLFSAKNPTAHSVGATYYYGMNKTGTTLPNVLRPSIRISLLNSASAIALALSLLVPSLASAQVLVFSKSLDFVHPSVPAGIVAMKKLGVDYGFKVDQTDDATYFNDDSLAKYDAVVFLNNCAIGETLLTDPEKAAFERFIRGGGGYAGIHCASSIHQLWTWYTLLVGAVVETHTNVTPGIIHVEDHYHLSTAALPDTFSHVEEYYIWKAMPAPLWLSEPSQVKVLMTLQEHSAGVKAGWPLSWYHEYDGGRSWYTALGHTEESYKEPLVLAHMLGGIRYAMNRPAVVGTKPRSFAGLAFPATSHGAIDLLGRYRPANGFYFMKDLLP